MAGVFFERESHCSPLICGCTLARDEGHPEDPDHHWRSSQYVVRCPEHQASGHSAADAHRHAMTHGTMMNAIEASLPHDAWVPTFREGATPKKVVSATGEVSWVLDESHIVERVMHPVEYIYSFTTEQVCFRHPHADAPLHAKVSKAIADHPHLTIRLATPVMRDTVFAEHDALIQLLADEEKINMYNAAGEIVGKTPIARTFWRLNAAKRPVIYSHRHPRDLGGG